MLWFWVPIGVFFAVIFVGAWLFDRSKRGKGSTFGDGMETNVAHLEAKNAARLSHPGSYHV